MRVYGSSDNTRGPPSSSSSSSNNNGDITYDEEYAISNSGGEVNYPDVGDRVPLLTSGGREPSTALRGFHRSGGRGNRKLKIVPRPSSAGDKLATNDPSSTSKPSSNSLKAALIAAVIFVVTLVSMGYVYNSKDNIGKSPFKVTESLDVKESSVSEKGEAKVLKDNLYDVCKLNTHSRVKETCTHPTTTFTVLGDEDGRWPVGFSWTVLKDGDEAVQDQKLFLHTERGEFDHAKTHGNDVQCKKFVTELCLSGDYVVYANSEDEKSANSAVNICDKKVVADEALDFSTDHVRCVSSSFELDPDFSEFKNKRNKHATILQALSMSGASGASMMSGTAGGSLSGFAVEGSMPTTEVNDDKGNVGDKELESVGGNETSSGNATVVSGNETVVSGNETVAPGEETTASGNETVASGNETISGTPSEATPPTVRPTTAYEYFFPPPLVPTAAPTPVSSLAWDGSPPTIEQSWDHTKGNVSKTFTQTIPEKWDETTRGFKYPTAAPTVVPSNADGSTLKPTTTGELFYPPTISLPLNEAYGNVTTHDYNSDWNNTMNGFTYPTAAPTIFPTVRPTVVGEINKPDCYLFGMVCDTPVSQQPSAEPTAAVSASVETVPSVGATSPNLRARLSTTLTTSQSSTSWNSMLKYVGLGKDESGKPLGSSQENVVQDPSDVIAHADEIAAAQMKKLSAPSRGLDLTGDDKLSGGGFNEMNAPLVSPMDGIQKNRPSHSKAKVKMDSSDIKSSHHHMHGAGGGAAVVEVVDVVAQKTKEGMDKAGPIAHKIASSAIEKVQSTLTEATEKMKTKVERKSHKEASKI